jgi:hypothetical protein
VVVWLFGAGCLLGDLGFEGFVLVFGAETVECFFGFAGSLRAIVCAAGAAMTVAGPVVEVVALDVAAVPRSGLPAPQAPTTEASTTASATARAQHAARLVAHRSGQGTNRKRDISASPPQAEHEC